MVLSTMDEGPGHHGKKAKQKRHGTGSPWHIPKGDLLGLKRRKPKEDRPALFEQIQSEADEWLRAMHRKDQHASIAGEIQNCSLRVAKPPSAL